MENKQTNIVPVGKFCTKSKQMFNIGYIADGIKFKESLIIYVQDNIPIDVYYVEADQETNPTVYRFKNIIYNNKYEIVGVFFSFPIYNNNEENLEDYLILKYIKEKNDKFEYYGTRKCIRIYDTQKENMYI